MFQGKSLLEIVLMGGLPMFILLFSSVLSFTIIINRALVFRASVRVKRTVFMNLLRTKLAEGNYSAAVSLCEGSRTPWAVVAAAGIKAQMEKPGTAMSAMERAVATEVLLLERYTSIVGTIGNIAVYIGLFGTVLGIIRAFRDIATMGQGGMNVVILGVSEALVATAAGLAVAIPGVIAYTWFTRRIDTLERELQLCASETADLIIPTRQ